MFKRWITRVGDVEFVHKSPKDACSYDIKLMEEKYNDKLQVIEMVSIDAFDEYAEALESHDKDDCYLKAYRAGWNDALHELAIDGAEEIKTRLWMFANKMKRK